MNDQNKKTLRQFQCRDYLWEIFEQMSQELECSVDYLVNEAMRQYARSRNYGGRAEPTGQVAAGPMAGAPAPRASSPGIAPAPAPQQPAPAAAPAPRARVPSQPFIPSAPPPGPPVRPSAPQGAGYPAPPAYGAPPPSNPGYPAPPPSRSSSGGFAAPPVAQAGYPAPPAYNASQGGYPNAGYGQAPASNPGYPAPPRPSSYPPPPTQRPPGPGGQPPPLRPSMPQQAAPIADPGHGAMPTLFVIFNGQKYPVQKEEFIIGRGNKTADLPIKDGNISRRHAAIIFQNGGFYMKDLGSTNGVEFQGRRVDTKRIEEGDVYQLCDYELRCTYR